MADDATNVLVNSATKTQTDQDKISLLGKADDVIGILANYFGVLGIPGAAQIFAALKLALEKPTPSSLSDLVERLDQLAKGTWDNPPAPWFIVLSERPFGLTYDPSNRPIRFRERLAAAAL